ncbi:hypothetical protein [Acinetobacter rathckeae]|uniref:hypothetical protein n=1 Tax=Acinetobacter rathckeae TaxID=2605272 RepID=UPI0018A2DF66|nr:hypothetical protein [Acinetobacter rathckeae]MBF7686954.1 hypothetical protein [Acinetobacter rathckeae]MBF7694642.1 hypothetical protein [Acinetobacter rathckeae]
MKFLQSKLVLSTILASMSFVATATHAAQDPSKSTNVRGTLISNCKESASKGNKLTSAEADKFCTCQVDAEGKITKAQEWQIISTVNQKKSPSTLPFIQQQNAAIQNCFGPQLTSKLKTLTEEAMKQQAAQPQTQPAAQ